MAKKSARAKRDELDSKQVLKDIGTLLKASGISAKIDTLTFSSPKGASCTCPDGRTGVLRVVGGRLICVCPD